MPTLDILCLANSYKRRGRCIAGLRLDGGGWIRPVARTPNGELYPEHFVLPDGSSPRVLDVVRVPLEGPEPSAHQPENWLVGDRPWQLVRRGLPANLAPLLRAQITDGPALL